MITKLTALPLTNAINLSPYLNFADESGFCPNRFLKNFGLNSGHINSETLIPSYLAYKIIVSISNSTMVDHIGLSITRKGNYSNIHPAIIANMQKSASLFDFLLFCSTNAALNGSHFKVWLNFNNGILNICHAGSLPYKLRGAEQTEYSRTLQLVYVVKHFLGDEWKPEQLCLASPLTPPHEIINITTSGKVLNNQSYGVVPVAIKLDDFAEKISVSRINHTIESEACNRLITSIQVFIEHDELSLPFISEIYGCSQRSIQRILKSQGVNFQAIINKLKIEHAMTLLKQNMDINQVSQILGYTDPSNFTRAFKKNTTIAPTSFQQLHFPKNGAK
ncbi:AraC family transcriptional regulator [Photobacterium chitinilyticum]|uniref:helix-turn-helix domain-containing protein n=1 Tax=Photobacterium chitinilyticum TaxID=2485123 RepID=UPI003D0DD9EF